MKDEYKYKIVNIIFSTFLILILILNIIKKDDLISIEERRKLEQFPQVSFSSIFDGSFFSKFDKYSEDQFIERNNWMKIKYQFEKNIFNKKLFNNIYEYNSYLIEQNYPLNNKSLTNIVNKINEINNDVLTENNKVYYSIIPDKNYFVKKDNLRLNYDYINEYFKNNIKGTYIDIYDSLKLEDYYYTDSHWKQEKIIDTANIIRKNLGFNTKINYQKEYITNFKGVYSGRYKYSNVEDQIYILKNDVIDNSKVFNYIDNKYYDIYNKIKIKSNDKYDIYLSGAVPLVKIINDNKKDKELIIFRDSYGSSISPLLLNDYSSIILVDTRYIAPQLLKNYINFNNQDILYLYSISIINESSALK